MKNNRMVTRTIEEHTFSVMACDTETAEIKILEIVKTGVAWSKDFDKLKELKKTHETDTLKLVAIQNEEVAYTLYGMDELDFIANAEKLPPRFSNED